MGHPKTHIWIIRHPEGEEKEAETLFERIMVENVPNLERKQTSRSRNPKAFQIRGIQRDSYQVMV